MTIRNPKASEIAAMLALGALVGMSAYLFIDNATKTGPGCPAPVPADWIGYCDDFDAR